MREACNFESWTKRRVMLLSYKLSKATVLKLGVTSLLRIAKFQRRVAELNIEKTGFI